MPHLFVRELQSALFAKQLQKLILQVWLTQLLCMLFISNKQLIWNINFLFSLSYLQWCHSHKIFLNEPFRKSFLRHTQRKKTPNASKMWNLICIAISFSKINCKKTKQNNFFLLLLCVKCSIRTYQSSCCCSASPSWRNK